MFFNLEPNFIKKLLRESGFSNFGHMIFLAKRKLFYFETKHFLIVLFADIWLFLVYTHMLQISYRNSYGKVLKNEWVQVDAPCAQTGVKSTLCTYVLTIMKYKQRALLHYQ